MDNILGIGILLLMVIFLFNNNHENFTNIVEVQPTKCFSCEKQLDDKNKYLASPSKCFSCETELHRGPPNTLVGRAQPTKCFSCEKQVSQLWFGN